MRVVQKEVKKNKFSITLAREKTPMQELMNIAVPVKLLFHLSVGIGRIPDRFASGIWLSLAFPQTINKEIQEFKGIYLVLPIKKELTRL